MLSWQESLPMYPSCSLKRSELEAGILALDLLAATPLFNSKKEVRRSLEQKGVYVNNLPLEAESFTPSMLATESSLVLRKGKKNYCVVRFE